MKCNYCGTENEAGVNNCTNCGAPLSEEAASDVAAAETVDTAPEASAAPVTPAAPVQPVVNTAPAAKANNHATEVFAGGIIASAIFILGIFLPYAKIAFAEISLIQGGIVSDAGIALILGLLALGASVTKRPVTILIMGALNTGFVALKAVAVASQAKGATFFGVNLVSYSIGYYCLWAGAILLIIVGIYGIIRKVNGNKTA